MEVCNFFNYLVPTNLTAINGSNKPTFVTINCQEGVDITLVNHGFIDEIKYLYINICKKFQYLIIGLLDLTLGPYYSHGVGRSEIP